MILPDIFEVPNCRSRKTIGVSTIVDTVGDQLADQFGQEGVTLGSRGAGIDDAQGFGTVGAESRRAVTHREPQHGGRVPIPHFDSNRRRNGQSTVAPPGT